jgi:hypothetical protein
VLAWERLCFGWWEAFDGVNIRVGVARAICPRHSQTEYLSERDGRYMSKGAVHAGVPRP